MLLCDVGGMLNTLAHYIKMIIQRMLVKLFGNVVSAKIKICLQRDSSLSSHNIMCKLRNGQEDSEKYPGDHNRQQRY